MISVEEIIRDIVYACVEEVIKDALVEIKMDISDLNDAIAELRKEVLND